MEFPRNEEALDDVDVGTRLSRIINDPWEFLKGVRTKDQVDIVSPVKDFPVYLDYLRLYVRVWQKEKRVAVPKSRRMKLSWTTIALYTWDTAFHGGRFNAFVSKKESDSDELVQRASFIMENYNPAILPKEVLPKAKYTENSLYFPEMDSKIQGFPSGANQLRQFTFSGLFFDEMAFWPEGEKAYAAAYPTIEGGGRVTVVSSAAPSFFQRICFDTIDQGREGEFDDVG